VGKSKGTTSEGLPKGFGKIKIGNSEGELSFREREKETQTYINIVGAAKDRRTLKDVLKSLH